MMTLITPEENALIQNLYEAATDLNTCIGDGIPEQEALELALVDLEDAGYVDGEFVRLICAQRSRNATRQAGV